MTNDTSPPENSYSPMTANEAAIPPADDGVFFHGEFIGCANFGNLFEIGEHIVFEVVERVAVPREGVRTIPVHVHEHCAGKHDS